jgi:hypothetical protein
MGMVSLDQPETNAFATMTIHVPGTASAHVCTLGDGLLHAGLA